MHLGMSYIINSSKKYYLCVIQAGICCKTLSFVALKLKKKREDSRISVRICAAFNTVGL